MDSHGADAARRVLLLTTPSSYRTQAFLDAARRLGLEALQAVDLPLELAQQWNYPLGVDFRDPDAAADRLAAALAGAPVDAVLALDDSGALLAARVGERLGLPHNRPQAAEAARNKRRMRELLAQAGAPSPPFLACNLAESAADIHERVEASFGYPCVVKPEELNGSRGVIRADGPEELAAAMERLGRMLGAEQPFLVEAYIPGQEVALEGLLDGEKLHVLALFDKPDPLEGPFFEETIYVTPSRLPAAVQASIAQAATRAAQALGLETGPVHAELRVNERGPWIVEVAGRSIGGLCSRILRFSTGIHNEASLEELILAQACGLPLEKPQREERAGGVMMIPIPEAGILRRVEGLDAAQAVPGVEDIEITARLNYPLTPLPEGDAYLGFIFARGESPEMVEAALRTAHAKLHFEILPEIPLLA